jgi:NAD+ kinase
MAAGGPVLAVDADAFVCTPLAMHGGSAPPLIVPAGAQVHVTVRPGFTGFQTEIDGHVRELGGERFTLTMHPGKVTLVKFDAAGSGLEALRRRGLITDSPRVLARDARERRTPGAAPHTDGTVA